MDKYRKAYEGFQDVYERCCVEHDGSKYERTYYEIAKNRLQGLELVACADNDITPEEFEEISSWKIRRITDEAHQ